MGEQVDTRAGAGGAGVSVTTDGSSVGLSVGLIAVGPSVGVCVGPATLHPRHAGRVRSVHAPSARVYGSRANPGIVCVRVRTCTDVRNVHARARAWSRPSRG